MFLTPEEMVRKLATWCVANYFTQERAWDVALTAVQTLRYVWQVDRTEYVKEEFARVGYPVEFVTSVVVTYQGKGWSYKQVLGLNTSLNWQLDNKYFPNGERGPDTEITMEFSPSWEAAKEFLDTFDWVDGREP